MWAGGADTTIGPLAFVAVLFPAACSLSESFTLLRADHASARVCAESWIRQGELKAERKAEGFPTWVKKSSSFASLPAGFWVALVLFVLFVLFPLLAASIKRTDVSASEEVPEALSGHFAASVLPQHHAPPCSKGQCSISRSKQEQSFNAGRNSRSVRRSSKLNFTTLMISFAFKGLICLQSDAAAVLWPWSGRLINDCK